MYVPAYLVVTYIITVSVSHILILSSNLCVYTVERTVCSCLPSSNEYNNYSCTIRYTLILSSNLRHSSSPEILQETFSVNFCVSSCLVCMVHAESWNFWSVQKPPVISAYFETSGSVRGASDFRTSPNDIHFFVLFFIRAISKLYICIPTNCTQLIYFINNTLKHMYCLKL